MLRRPLSDSIVEGWLSSKSSGKAVPQSHYKDTKLVTLGVIICTERNVRIIPLQLIYELFRHIEDIFLIESFF